MCFRSICIGLLHIVQYRKNKAIIFCRYCNLNFYFKHKKMKKKLMMIEGLGISLFDFIVKSRQISIEIKPFLTICTAHIDEINLS
jgi:hypothetical protein